MNRGESEATKSVRSLDLDRGSARTRRIARAKGKAPRAGGWREVGELAAPFVVTQMLVTAMGVVDSAIVGRLGAAPLGAVGLSGLWVWTLGSFFVGATTAVQTFVAQRHGAGHAEECGAWCWQGLASAVPPAIVAAAVVWLGAGPFIDLLSPSDAVAPLAESYMRARAPGIIGLTAAVALSSFFRGIGDARTPLVATLVANGANLFLDFALVYGWFGFPRLEVLGAGIATSISEWIYLSVVAIAFVRPGFAGRHATGFRRPDLDAIRRLWRIGIPIGGQWITEMLAIAVFMTFVARMGDAALAASHAFIQLLSLSFMQAEGLSMAAQTLVGRYVGAARPELVARSYHTSIGMGALLAFAIAALFLLVPEALIGIFTTDPEVLALARPLLMIGALYQLCDAIAIISDGALRGTGDTRWPFVVRSLFAWGVLLPLAWLLAFPIGLGLTGAWSAGMISMAMLAILLVRRFRSEAWRRIRI